MPESPSVALPSRLPLVVDLENRDDVSTEDSRLINGYIERNPNTKETHLYKRPGLTATQTKTGNGYGVYNWRGNIYAIHGTTVYKDGTSIGTVDATGGVYRFSPSLGGTLRLTFGNGVEGYTTDGTTVTLISDSDFPTTFVKGWAYLDATTYVMDSEANIQGSNLNDTTAWAADNVITAQIEADDGVALGKQLVYVIALKQWSGEVFYDAAKPAGSPLGAVQGAKINFGCVTAESLQDVEGTLIWLATNRAGSVQVIALEGLKAQRVSTKAVERLLRDATFTTGVYSWHFRIDGHTFYGLTVTSVDLTLVFDLTERMWYLWSDTNGNYWPIVSVTFDTQYRPILQHATNGKLYRASTDFTNDDNNLISVDVYTPNFDAGTRRMKELGAMEFVGDREPGSILQVRVSDDDYRSWSNFRNVDLNQDRPRLTDCGSFSRRAWHLRHRANTKFRMQAVDLQLNLGTV